MNELEEFAKALTEDPSLLERLRKREELDGFKELYNLARATPLKCPACSSFGQPGGSLWINKDDPKRFVCRRCKLEWIIECQTTSNEELILKLREANKK